jgi:hypothetical protein
MARPLRFEYLGAVFHVMARGDGGKVIFIEKEDHLLFGKLTEYEWSSLSAYRRGKGPTWLVCERVLGAFELVQNGRGRRAYVEYLEKRAANDGGNISEASMAALRRGWYLGAEAFRDRLLDLVKKGSKILVKKGSHAAAPIRRHGELEAEKIVVKGLKQFGLLDEAGCISPSRKGDPLKVALASVVKAHTSVGNEWLAIRLAMGHNRSVSRLIRQGNNDDKIKKLCAKLTKLLPCED